MDEETYEYLIPIVIIIIIITIVCIYKNIYSSNNIPKIIHQTYPTNQVNKDIQTSREGFTQTNTVNPENKKRENIVPVRKEKKVNRNDPCPCGSGKKYKKCCGKK